jgi:hypothetical protein
MKCSGDMGDIMGEVARMKLPKSWLVDMAGPPSASLN